MTPAVHATSSATALVAAIRAGTITASELLETYLDRIERLDAGDVNAVVTLAAERARAEAARADQAVARGDELGPLHGLPITVKDAIATAGIRSTAGATELADHVPIRDAPAVARLRAAGAIVLGKTNLPRWCSDSQSFNELFGTTHNPWSPAHTPGGSSGGSAAAVAAGFTGADLGTDIGGSIRAPAHCCGVYGLKPSYGVISNLGYLDHVGGGSTGTDINVFGPIARSADDLDLLLAVLAAPSPDDALAWQLSLPGSDRRSLHGLRVAVWIDDVHCPVDAEYLGILHSTVDAIADAGAVVEESRPNVGFREQVDVYRTLVAAAMSPSMPDAVAEVASGSHRAWLRHDETRAAMRRAWATWFADHDVLLMPVLCTPAFRHDQVGAVTERTVSVNGVPRSHTDISEWLMLVNLVNLPSVAAPIGRTAAGLPVGLQVVAPFLRDHRAIAVARMITAIAGGYQPPPGFGP